MSFRGLLPRVAGSAAPLNSTPLSQLAGWPLQLQLGLRYVDRVDRAEVSITVAGAARGGDHGEAEVANSMEINQHRDRFKSIAVL